MSTLLTVKQVKSLTIGFTFPETYDTGRVEEIKVYLGKNVYPHTIDGRVVKCQIKSDDTAVMYGANRLSFWLDDSIIGVYPVYCGDIVFEYTNAIEHNESVNTGFDLMVNLTISETAITVDNVLYNYVKGDKGDPFIYSDFTPEQIAELQQPASDAIASIEAVELSVEQAEALRVQAEIDRQTNTGTAIQNAETATGQANDAAILANTKAGLADTAATNANTKAGLADTAATNANTKAGLADAAANNANAIANSKPTIFEGYASLSAGIEKTIAGTSFTPALNLQPANVQVYQNGEIKDVSAKYVLNNGNYDIKLTSDVDLVEAEIIILGASLKYQKWMRKPLFSLPEILPLMVGEEVTIHGDTLINVPISNNLQITYTCGVGTQTGNNFTINPTSTNVGDNQLIINCKNGDIPIAEYTIKLRVYEKSTTGTKKMLMIGDSVMANNMIFNYGYYIRLLLSNNTITFVGTQGINFKHEGRGGWSFNSFINVGSPFVKNGVLDIAAYFTDNVIDIPDYVVIQMGINDVFSSSAISGDGLTDEELNTIITDAKTLIDGFINFNTSINVLIEMPTICENSGAGWNANYDESVYSQNKYIECVHRLSKRLTEEFSEGIYNSRVTTGYNRIFMDRNEGYPKTDGIHINGVHPGTTGQQQLAKSIVADINRLIIRDIVNDGQTAGMWDYTKNITQTSNLITEWGSEIGTNNLTSSGALRPTLQADGIAFNGANAIAGTFTFDEPSVIFIVVKVNSWDTTKSILDGAVFGSARLIMAAASPNIYIYGTSYAAENKNLIIGKFAVIQVIADEANSKIKINTTATTTGDPNGVNMGGLTIGANAYFGAFSNIVVKKVIARRSIDGAADLHNLLLSEYSAKDF